MKPKDKTEELLRKNLIIVSNLEIIYGNNIGFEELKLDSNFKKAIECAKIAVDEIVEAGNDIISELIDGYHDLEFNIYWQEVKNELNKML